MQDITAVYYTVDKLPRRFAINLHYAFSKAIGIIPLVVIRQSKNIKSSHLQIYRNALEGAKKADTKYIALCEDDILYHEDHFKFRPKDGHFGYNMNVWAIYTWVKPAIFSYKDRINLGQLICERELFIKAMEERFAKYPTEEGLFLGNWAEPGKYEKNLHVTEQKIEKFYSDTPNVAFSHETALSFQNLGTRKKLGNIRALEIPYWGKAKDILKLYE